MDFQSYLSYSGNILTAISPAAPYDQPDYFNYTKLNVARMKRWLKTAVLTEEVKFAVKGISRAQHWIVITEPWCGDAAHIVPFVQMIAELNDLVSVSYELRDSAPFRINDYLSNGGKSIPKLIIKDAGGEDLATWGPRPAGAQLLYARLIAEKADFETLKTELQKWYNNDEGVSIQMEFAALVSQLNEDAAKPGR